MRLLPHRRDERVESEDGQARFRLWAALLMLAAYATFAAASADVPARAVACVAVYATYACAWAWVVALGIGRPAPRQWMALCLDIGLFSACVAAGGRATAALSWVAVTTSVGHGLRFGERRGIAAALMAGAGLFAAVRFGPGWQLPLSVALGIGSTAVVAPVYVVGLVRTIDRQRREAEARARELEQAMRLDALTGAHSRAGFAAMWSEHCGADGRTTTPLGVVYIDLDGFKSVNDTLGHDVGDRVLRQVATLLKDNVRVLDVVARWGGDEFVILVVGPRHEQDVAQAAAKALQAVRAWGASALEGVTLGASAGCAYAPVGSTRDVVLQLADERMFEVKRDTRSRRRAELAPT